MRLEGKVAVITGASRGLGLALSKAFSKESAKVAMLARGAAELDRAASSIVDAIPLPCDVSDSRAVRDAFSKIRSEVGDIDLLINSAAIAHPQLVEDSQDKLLHEEVAVNLLGPVYCMREALISMRSRKVGDIVNITSEALTRPYPYLGMYAATKSALETLTENMREELRGENIRLSIYRSGRLATNFSQSWDPEIKHDARTAARQKGFYDASGGPVSTDVVADAILKMVLLDRSAAVDMMTVRGV